MMGRTAAFALALLVSAAGSTAATLAPGFLRCESVVDPLAVEASQPRLSWILESVERDQRQSAYRILVAISEEALGDDRGDLWDSGKVTGNESLGIEYAGAPLHSGQRCLWKVRVWDGNNQPSDWSPPAVWEMGLLRPDDWHGCWINDGRSNPTNDAVLYREDPAPLFRREFQLLKPVRRARLYLTGLGSYEASLDGQRVGDNLLDPAWTAYDRRVFYSTYDVAAQLRVGANCLGVTLGNGWWNPLPLRFWGNKNIREHLPVGRPRFRAQLEIQFTDGTSESLASDESWKVADGPVRFNNLYLGEVYDARREVDGWDRPGFNDASWRPATRATETVGLLQTQPLPPIRGQESFPAVRVTRPQPGVFIYDLGRNFTGWASIRLRSAPGTKLVLRYGELLNADGTLNPLTSVAGQIKGTRAKPDGSRESVGGPGAPPVAWQSDTYICRGASEENYTPRFTFHAFRYVEITGLETALPLTHVHGLALCSDVADAGSFACSHPLLNEIQAMCRRTFRSNLMGVQSDCPHRERFGYGGDIVATSEALMLNFDMENFYAKVAQDFADSARPDGMLTDTAPFVGIQYCGVGWAMAHPLLVAQLHRYYENRRLVQQQYEVARRWLRLVADQYPDGIVTQGLSDHESLTATPAPPLVTPLFYQSARLVEDLARTLGRTADMPEFASLAEKSRQAYRQRCFDVTTGRAGPGTQGSQAFAICSDLLPPVERGKAMEVLLADIREARTNHLSTGILGTKFMLDGLSRAGHADTAYTLVQQTNFPGWGWMLANGATTLWEHWTLSDNTYSHNHPMFGSISQWFINWLGGIQPDPQAVGFDRIILRPQMIADLQWVECSYRSARGRIVCNWSRKSGRLRVEVVLPANTRAELHLPAASAERVTEGGQPVAASRGVRLLSVEPGDLALRLGSGHYQFDLTQ